MPEIYQRSTGTIIEEKIYGEKAIHFTCNTKTGRLITNLILKRKFLSKIVAKNYKNKRSVKKIGPFIKQYGIDRSQLSKQPDEYSSFNEFFTRKIEHSYCKEKNILISPADSRLIVHKITDCKVLSVKGGLYTVEELLQDKDQAAQYKNGYCLVFRLSPTDYHRFCFPDSGSWETITKIKGNFNTVNTFFTSSRVHATNYREKTTLNTDHFGKVIFIEVGAMLIGKIVQTAPCPGHFTKGQEKGYFEYGASTIIMLIKDDALTIDQDILEQSKQGRECLVGYGEAIGRI